MSAPKLTLPQRALGRTGLSVSVLALGLVKIGRNQGVKYPTTFELPQDGQILSLLRQAHSLGINLLDTAPAYGSSETRLGQALRALPELANDFLISTKVGETFANNRSSFDFSPSAIRASVERSLDRLGVGRLDLVLVHSDGADLRVLQEHAPLATLQALKTEGLVRACGFSGKTLDGGEQALAQGAEVLMLTLNQQDSSQLPLLAAAQKHGAGVLIKKPLASGHDSSSALRDIIRHQQISSVVVGTLSRDHLAENAAAITDG